MPQKLYEKKIITIEEIDVQGRGTANIGTARIAVPFSFPGDVGEVKLVKRERGILIGELERLITPSPHRVPPRCPHASQSGGCYWQLLEYGAQLYWKREIVASLFRRAQIDVLLPEVVPASTLYEFRNKMEFAVGKSSHSEDIAPMVIGTKRLGKWWDIIDMDGCLLQSQESGEVVRRIRTYMTAQQLQPWDHHRHEGFVRYVVIREGKFTGRRMVILVTSDGVLPAKDALIESLTPFVSSLYHGINRTLSDTAVTQELTLLSGDQYLTECIHGLNFLIHPSSFFQTNSFMIDTLVQAVGEAVGLQGGERLLDLYCGLGLFSLSFASKCENIIGVEVVPEAIELARRNRDLNRISNVEFRLNKAEDLTWVGTEVDAAIIDPPPRRAPSARGRCPDSFRAAEIRICLLQPICICEGVPSIAPGIPYYERARYRSFSTFTAR